MALRRETAGELVREALVHVSTTEVILGETDDEEALSQAFGESYRQRQIADSGADRSHQFGVRVGSAVAQAVAARFRALPPRQRLQKAHEILRSVDGNERGGEESIRLRSLIDDFADDQLVEKEMLIRLSEYETGSP